MDRNQYRLSFNTVLRIEQKEITSEVEDLKVETLQEKLQWNMCYS
jgi:hypothetical protein